VTIPIRAGQTHTGRNIRVGVRGLRLTSVSNEVTPLSAIPVTLCRKEQPHRLRDSRPALSRRCNPALHHSGIPFSLKPPTGSKNSISKTLNSDKTHFHAVLNRAYCDRLISVFYVNSSASDARMQTRSYIKARRDEIAKNSGGTIAHSRTGFEPKPCGSYQKEL
jgi:hypothetical protein